MNTLANISDAELRARLKRLAKDQGRISVELVRHLAEYDRRELYRADGLKSLWDYCEKVLDLSPAEIKLRTQAARALNRVPELSDALDRGETTVSSVGRLAPHLTSENCESLIEGAKGKTRVQVEQLVAGLSAARAMSPAGPSLFDSPGAPPSPPSASEIADWVRRENPDQISPVSEQDWKLNFVASAEVVKGLEFARALLARRYPNARLEDIIGALLKMFMERHDPARRVARRRERAAARDRRLDARKPIRGSRREEVLARDGHQCTFVGPEGRCTRRDRLEVDHIIPRALGGSDALDNLRAMCPMHNRFLAKLAFGTAYIERAIAQRRAASARTVSLPDGGEQTQDQA